MSVADFGPEPAAATLPLDRFGEDPVSPLLLDAERPVHPRQVGEG